MTNVRTPIVEGAIVTPYRFTDRPREMIAFFETLGLRAFLRQGDFAVLAGRSGRVAIHPRATEAGDHQRTALVLGVPDVPTAVTALAEAGLDAIWWDESWGRQASVSGPIGAVSLDAEWEDPYGYDVAEAPDAVDPGVDVVATVRTADIDAATAYFSAFGFSSGPDASPAWVPLRGSERSGVIGLFPTGDDDAAPVMADGDATTEIGIETAEPLDGLAARLRDAGHRVEMVDGSGPRHVVVTDPDGITLEVYAAG
jgi:catechol 2,3-dioxygenase-like lactoylglutathione lyase family enzyme